MRSYNHALARLVQLGLTHAAILVFTLPCAAQRQPLVMTHGIRSDAATWDQTASALTFKFPVAVHRFTTQWKTPYLSQANELLSSVFAGLPDTTLAIGHSNGGLVLRQAALLNAPLRGLATVGSPNFGAPAADAIRKNYMSDLITPILIRAQSISYALSPPDFSDGEEQWYFDFVIAFGGGMINLVNEILAFAGFDPSYSIWDSMYPTSAFMQNVNSPSSLALQAQRAPIRASIRTYIDDPHQAVWRLAIPQSSVPYFEAIRDVGSTMALYAGLYYTDKYCYSQQNNPLRCNASSLFFDMSADLQLIEGRYCYKMTFVNATWPYPFPCFATDAVVPLENQIWGPPNYAVPYEVQGPSHTEQPKSTAVRASLEAFLQAQAGVAECGTGAVVVVQIAPQAADLLPGTTTPLAVHSLDRCSVTVTSPPPITHVSSSNPAVAMVTIGNQVINVHAIAAGVATVTAVVNGISATRTIAVGAGIILSVTISGGPRENLTTGETVWLYANASPSGQGVTYEWRVNGGAVMSTAAVYGHSFQGPTTISVTATGADGQTATATAELSGSGTQLRAQPGRVRPSESH